MEKLDLQIFRNLKQEVVEYMQKYKEAEEREEDLTEEEEEKFLERYKEIIQILSEHDLSDIDFEEWGGMILSVNEDIPIDFSKTKANLDFSIIEYESFKVFPNFKSCQIKNFNFEKSKYSPEMFDEEYRKENKGRFLSEAIPEDVADRFYKGKLNLLDIKNNPELINKIEEKNLDYYLKKIYKRIGREEFCKLDAEFIDETKYRWENLLNAKPNLRTAEEIMSVLYKSAREQIIGYSNDAYRIERFNYRQEQLGEKFREQNPDLFLSEEAPEKLRDDYYNHSLSLKSFSENLKYFDGKTVAQSFKEYGEEKKIISLYGESVYQLFNEYKPIMDKIVNDYRTMQLIEVPSGPISEEQRKEIMSSAISSYFSNIENIEDISMLKMITDFVPLESLQLNDKTREFLEKYDIEELIKVGLDLQYLTTDKTISSLDEIKKLNEIIEKEDIQKLLSSNDIIKIEQYGVEKLLEFGIKDLSELSKNVKDLQQVKELMKQRPIDLINMGKFTDQKLAFINKYGIDNIIKLDEETNGMFSHAMWQDDIYLTMLAHAETRMPEFKIEKELTYSEFRDRMYEILLHARDERSPLQTRDYPDYDFIQGEFRKEHPEIFIDGNISKEVKEKFYTATMLAKDVKQNPELIQLLQGKDLSRVFTKKMTAGLSLSMQDKNGNIFGGIPNTVNMAEYLSNKIGQEEFLKICADYGECLDSVSLSTENEVTVESVRNAIEEAIYKGIKERGIKYFGDLPLSFQERYPDLFLPESIPIELRKKFYSGKLNYEDIRKNPELKEILQSKDIGVGMGKKKYGQPMLGNNGQRYVNPMWEKLTTEEILDFSQRYGKYLINVDGNIFNEGQNQEEKEKVLREEITKNVLSRKSQFDDTAPAFLKEAHPEIFLDDNAPEELKLYFYDGYISKAEEYMNHASSNYAMSFKDIKEHPEWIEFLKGKDLKRGFSKEYAQLFNIFDSSTLIKLRTGNPETIDKMVRNHKENVLENWYKSTGGKFVPHHVVMLNFPTEEIDSFLGNGKKWSQLMKIDNYNLNDDGKTAILKAAYSMGVFQGSDDGFNKIVELFTGIPRELSEEEYNKVVDSLGVKTELGDLFGPPEQIEKFNLFKDSYSLWQDKKEEKETETEENEEEPEKKYVLKIDKQKAKQKVKDIRAILEQAELPKILTSQKAHQIFDSFAMEYNPDFARVFNENIEKILSNPEYAKDIATIQRQFKDIARTNAGRRLTLEVAQDYIRSIAYNDIEVGNEGVAEQAKIAGYSQKDFEAIQTLYNEGETREFSSIPRIQGKTNRYTYEMLRCDDPLALTIGTLTDCCQEIHGAGQTSMEHSVVSPDGRVFCVKDNEGRLVAQSWFWRNQYTGCFDNIEIPDRIFELYKKEHPDGGKKGLTTDVLEVYKKAAQDLMKEDKRVYQELLENGTITQEQYDSLLLGKVTIGLGYNDIADAIKTDETIHQENDNVAVKGTERLPNPYTDAKTQYTIAEREGILKSKQENLYVHQDDVPVYDGTNMTSTVLLTMKRMEQAKEKDNLAYLNERRDEEKLPKSQRIINSIAREYGFDPNNTKIMATARIALIYSKDKDKVKIGELLSVPLKSGLTEEQKQKAESHIMYQIKKALKQIGISDSEVDMSLLDEEQQQMLQSAMKEIEKENTERGER